VSAILERMIARVRAPLSAVEPVLPPRFAPPAWASGPDGAPSPWASGPGEVGSAGAPGSDEVMPARDAGVSPIRTAADPAAVARPGDAGAPDAPAPGAARTEPPEAAASAPAGSAAPRANATPRVRAVAASAPVRDATSASADVRDVLRSDPAVPSPAALSADEPQASRRRTRGEPSTTDRGDRALQPIEVRVTGEVGAEPAADREPAAPTPSWPPDGAGASVVRDAPSGGQAPREPIPPPAPQGPPTEVHISIGHIEVRSAPPAPAPRKPALRPRVTLDDYLRRRNGGAR